MSGIDLLITFVIGIVTGRYWGARWGDLVLFATIFGAVQLVRVAL